MRDGQELPGRGRDGEEGDGPTWRRTAASRRTGTARAGGGRRRAARNGDGGRRRGTATPGGAGRRAARDGDGGRRESLTLAGNGEKRNGEGAIGLEGEDDAGRFGLSRSGSRESSGSSPRGAFAFHVYFPTALPKIASQFLAVCLGCSFWALKAPKAEVEAQTNAALGKSLYSPVVPWHSVPGPGMQLEKFRTIDPEDSDLGWIGRQVVMPIEQLHGTPAIMLATLVCTRP
jgi:hypothetical protein